MRPGRRSFVLAAASSIVTARALADPIVFERPRTLMAFLRNMKRAAEAGALLDPAFYADTNLKRAFAADYVTYGRPLDGIRTYGSIGGFGVLADGVRVGGSVREAMQLDFTLSAPRDAPPEGNLRLTFLVPKRSFDDIEAAFGRNWKQADYKSPANNQEPFALRHHGSSAISYALRDSPPGGWMNFSFDARAQLELATVANR